MKMSLSVRAAVLGDETAWDDCVFEGQTIRGEVVPSSSRSPCEFCDRLTEETCAV